ncbi:MAG: ATP-dependent Clp protease ATP-binding subunit, partial [Bacteroidetes bacterium]
MDAKFSQRVKDVLSFSREEAIRLGNNYIGLEHFILGLLREGDGLAVQLLNYFGVDLKQFKASIEDAVRTSNGNTLKLENIPFVKQAEKALKITYLEAKLFNSDLIGTEHLLLAILKDENNLVTRKLESLGVNYNNVKEELITIRKEKKEDTGYFEPKAELPGETEEPEEGP